MRFLSEMYGDAVYLHHLKNDRKQPLNFLSNFLFSGFEFAQKPLFFGNIFCRREHYQNTTKCFICLSSTRYPKSKSGSLKKVIYAIRKIRDENKMGFEIISPNPISNTNTGFSYTDSLMS